MSCMGQLWLCLAGADSAAKSSPQILNIGAHRVVFLILFYANLFQSCMSGQCVYIARDSGKLLYLN